MTAGASRNLAVFLSNGRGLADWKALGSLAREVAVYERLAGANWNIAFHTYDRTSDFPDPGFPAKVVTQWPFLLPRRIDAVYGLCLPVLRFPKGGDRPAVVMTNQAHSGWPAVLAAKLWGARLIARCGYVYGEREQVAGRTGLRVRRRCAEEKLVFQSADRCVVPTEACAAWITEHYRIDESKVLVVPNYVDTQLFRPMPAKQSVDVISIGRLVAKKGHHLLLEALAGTGLRIRIVGSGKMRNHLLAIAKMGKVDLDLVPSLKNDELPAALNQARLYANLSSWEGHPKALIEAMACGRACLGADSPGIHNLLEHDRNGWLVGRSKAEIRKAIVSLLGDEPKRAKLGSAARDHAEAEFSLDHVFDLYSRLLDDLVTA
jgi:glycosyltransferase involved in cell wall biosynthesis